MKVKVTNTDTFISKANEVHNSKYNYDKAEFITSKTKTTITCYIHGDFEQTPNNHLSGFGCQECAKISRSTSQAHSTSQFIDKANSVHNGKYTYELVDYKSSSSRVLITCRDHGVFSMSPSNHTNKTRPQGCPTCGALKAGTAKRLKFVEFVDRAHSVHNNSYTYNPDTYDTFHVHTAITCQTHGEFFQTPAHHLGGTGCPQCATYGFNINKPAILYYLKINGGQAYKIGITNRSVNERFSIKDLKSIEVVFSINFQTGKDALYYEQQILKVFCDNRYTGINLLESGNTELFSTDILDSLTNSATISDIQTILDSIHSKAAHD